jgi:hypothetical protein
MMNSVGQVLVAQQRADARLTRPPAIPRILSVTERGIALTCVGRDGCFHRDA